MPTYSSEQFFQDWRYAVAKDFVSSDGSSFPYAENGKLQWGDEMKKIFCDGAPHDGCISTDGSHIAISVWNDIHVIKTATWKTIAVLKGHISRVSALAFKPGDPNVLVSSEQQDYGRADESLSPVIIFWKIDESSEARALEEKSLTAIAAAASSAAADKLIEFGVDLDRKEMDELEGGFALPIARTVTKHIVANNNRIHGRLQTSFQSEVFSPSGKYLVYLPGSRPRSNSVAPWNMIIYSTEYEKVCFTLEGHTDAIMWTSWNQDESRFASVAWDGTIRIWDASTGQQLYQFETERQNWTGAFSPDSKYLAAADGNGIVRVYSLDNGEPHWEYKDEEYKRWRRCVAWHPNSQWLAAGGELCGDLLLLDVAKKQVLQERVLSLDASKVDREEQRRILKSYCGVKEIRFLDNGNKLAVWTGGDCSIEVYDITRQVKWRFARGGTDDGPTADAWRDENGKVTSGGGQGMLVWEVESEQKIFLVSIDFDGLRVWAIKLDGRASDI